MTSPYIFQVESFTPTASGTPGIVASPTQNARPWWQDLLVAGSNAYANYLQADAINNAQKNIAKYQNPVGAQPGYVPQANGNGQVAPINQVSTVQSISDKIQANTGWLLIAAVVLVVVLFVIKK